MDVPRAATQSTGAPPQSSLGRSWFLGPVGPRAPLLKAYLRRAPGARPHIDIDKDAPLSEFAKIAEAIRVFRVVKSHPEDRLVGAPV